LDGIPDASILEVGCGTGLHDCRGFGVDLDPARAREFLARGRPGVAADALRLPFADRTFSRILCEGMFHHIDDEGVRIALSEMRRVCRQDGLFVIMDSVWPRSPWRALPWILRWMDFGRHVRTEEQLRKVLGSCGARLIWSRRFTYSTIGLECLMSVLAPDHP
jgi:SAM-dependent methyltransferase